jgi:glycosyltransferase involved in cell wall biosynthesis
MRRMTDPVRISVVIPTFNRRDRLQRLLEALAAQEIDEPFEVVVVSDGSTDGTDAYLTGPTVPLPIRVVLQTNQGPAAARNGGVEQACGDLVVFIDDDVVPVPAFLAKHRAAHVALGPDAVVIGPMIDPVGHDMTPWVRYEQAMLRKQYDAMEAGYYAATARQFYTGNASVPRELLIATGGFDPAFRRMEDLELAYRLDDRGVRWHFEPTAIGHHFAERSFESWRHTAYSYGRNDVIFGRDLGHENVLRVTAEEYGSRHVLVRTLIRLCVPRPRLSALVDRFVGAVVQSRLGMRAPRLTRLLLSGDYNLAYYRGVADELGDPGRLRELVAGRS